MKFPILAFLLLRGNYAFYMQALDGHASRRTLIKASGGLFGLPFFGGGDNAASAASNNVPKSKGPTNEIVKVVNGT
jgi:hypothetical protein